MIPYPTGTSPCTYAVEPPCTEPYARWCERTAAIRRLLLDYGSFIRNREAVAYCLDYSRIDSEYRGGE